MTVPSGPGASDKLESSHPPVRHWYLTGSDLAARRPVGKAHILTRTRSPCQCTNTSTEYNLKPVKYHRDGGGSASRARATVTVALIIVS